MHRHRRGSSELRLRTQRNTQLNRTKRTNLRTRPVDNSHASVNPSDYEVHRNNNAYLHNRGSSRRAQFHRCHCQHRSDKRRHVRQGRPHHLDLSDPMFRQGLGVYMRQELPHLSFLVNWRNHRHGLPTTCSLAVDASSIHHNVWKGNIVQCLSGRSKKSQNVTTKRDSS